MDLQLNRLKDSPLPGHLRHLGITQVTETYGRERRYKYFTFANYEKIVEKEELESPYPEGFFIDAGGFLPIEEDQFYRTDAELFKYVTGQTKPSKGKGKDKAKADFIPKTPARGKKRKRDDEAVDIVVEATPAEGVASTSMAPPPLKKKRGRPPKNPLLQPATPGTGTIVLDGDLSATPQIETLPPATPPTTAKKRGRPRKNPVEPTETPIPKKRGRPPKNKAGAGQAAAAELVIRPYVPPTAQPGPTLSCPESEAASSSAAQEAEPSAVPVEPIAVAYSETTVVGEQEPGSVAAIRLPTEVPSEVAAGEDVPPNESQPPEPATVYILFIDGHLTCLTICYSPRQW